VTTTLQARNPRTGVADYSFAAASPAEVAAAVKELRGAQKAWAAAPVEDRIAVLQAFKAALAARQNEIVAALEIDTGRRRIAASEVMGTLAAIDRRCKQAPELLKMPTERSQVFPHIRFAWAGVPYAVAGMISPWNFPMTLSLVDAIPALLAGCAVLLKPSEVTPRFADPLMAAIQDVPALSPVFKVVRGAAETGQALIANCDVVCFTGSVATGKKVAAAAAEAFIPAFLELGGKDPVIVAKSADLDTAVSAVLRGSVVATGQACQSIERVYVDEAIAGPFTEKLTAAAAALDLNWPDIGKGHIGPLIFAKQAETIASQLADAVAKGATIRTGGKVEDHGGGKWVRPTVVTGVTHQMTLMTEETFGPIIPVMSFKTVEEAITLANDSIYGLSAAVLAGTDEEALAIAVHLEAGAVSINDTALTSMVSEAEKNSFKLSGMGGSRMGPAGITRFLRKRAFLINEGKPADMASYAEG